MSFCEGIIIIPNDVSKITKVQSLKFVDTPGDSICNVSCSFSSYYFSCYDYIIVGTVQNAFYSETTKQSNH